MTYKYNRTTRKFVITATTNDDKVRLSLLGDDLRNTGIYFKTTVTTTARRVELPLVFANFVEYLV